MNSRTLGGSLLFAATLGASVATPIGAQDVSAHPKGAEAPVQNDFSLRDWRSEHGSSWRVRVDRGTGFARLLSGGSASASMRPRGDAEFAQVALQHLRDASQITGVDPDTLRLDRVRLLPFGLTGGTDKFTVRFEQRLADIPVEDSSVTVLLSRGGDLLSIDAQALPGISAMDTLPQTTASAARAFARQHFAESNGMNGEGVGTPRLVVFQELVGKRRKATLAWQVEVRNVSPDGVAAYQYTVAARGDLRILESNNHVHQFDVGGTVSTLATPGLAPDTGSNPETVQPMSYATVSGPAGTTTTDANGNFNFPGVNGPLNLTFTYTGTFNDVTNDAGPDYVLNQSLTGTNNSVLMNPSPTEETTSQANAFVQLNVLRDWVRTVNPSDDTMDEVNTSLTNEDFVDFGGGFIITSCNAFFGGSSTNYFLAAGGCVNTAFSTVIAHEQGHWLNVRYNSGNGPDGFGEGNADVFAMYLYDNPVVGDGFFGPGSNIRTGTNTLQYCGDGNGGCFGAVHTDGQVHMGAMWKMRRNLKQTHGTALGGAIADQLFLGWMNAFDQGSIDSIVLEQLLTLDDDDGNIDNGTPNYLDMNAAFMEQGFPGFELTLIGIDNVIAIEDTLDEIGPYGVAAELTAFEAAGIANATVELDSGSGFQSFAMTQQPSGTYTVLLPGIASPADVSYYISVTDTAGNSETWPKDSPASAARFSIGERQSYFFESFDGATDAGWTHVELATQDDWQRGVPAGRSGTSSGVNWSDPSAPFSGSSSWGNDLGGTGFNGAYQPNVSNVLRSPPIDLSLATGAELNFRRWLTVEEGTFDQAEIRLNGATVWSNPQNGNLIDTEWVLASVDLSAADGDPSAEIEFSLETDGGLNLGGWNIDDLEIFSLDETPSDCQPSNYGGGLVGTGGLTPRIDSGGQQSKIGNSDFAIEIKNGVPLASAIVGFGFDATDIPIFGGNLLVVPIVVETVPLDLFGQSSIAFPLGNAPGLLGATFFMQAFIGDAGAPEGFSMTPGLEFTICN